MILSFTSIFLFVFLSFCKGDVIYPKRHENQELATRIYCQVEDPQQFQYSSITELWGVMGGQITLEADITVRCMGDDQGGTFENEALKYRVQVTNLKLTETKVSDKESMIRHKRGAGEFFSRSWDQIKQFFKRVFRRKTKEPEVTKVVPDQGADERRETPANEEPAEDFNISDYESMYSIPFQFLQFANGSIPEIRFTENEVDSRVKNFKRHLVDAFSTQLNFNHKQKAVVEKSIMGEHTSMYNITVNSPPSASLSIAGFGSRPVKSIEPTVVVKKLVTEGDILRLAPSEALNDRDRMDIKVEQMQVFEGGRMISSSGFSSLVLLSVVDTTLNRLRRDDDEEDDVTSHLQTHSTFDIQLQTRERRSAKLTVEQESDENVAYLPADRIAEFEDDSQRHKLRVLHDSTMETAVLFEHLLSGNNIDYDKNMQSLFERVEKEVSLKVDKANGSVSSSVRMILSKEVMHEFCTKNFSICKDFLQLLTLAGGPEAEHVLLSLLNEGNALSPHSQAISDIISDITDPSPDLLRSLVEIIQKNSANSGSLGALCLSLGHLASKSSEQQESVLKIFLNLLRDRKKTCRADPFVIDLLEAIGNLKSEDPLNEVLEISSLCGDHDAVQIACVHALRHSVHLPALQKWMQNITSDGNCDVIREVIGSLTDKIRDQETDTDPSLWPRFGFNSLDHLLSAHLTNASLCSVESDIRRYFRLKKNDEANALADNWEFRGDVGRSGETLSRLRRAAWDDLNCREWTEDDSKFRPIQDREEFASDRATYNRRKSCLAFRRLGVKGANAEIYAGMFAGVKEPSEPPKYKLFTKFVSGLNFLGHEMEIGSFYFYHLSGKTKAYVRILGRTRQEFTNEGCTPTDLSYRPLKHIPLYMVNVGTVQLSLGIHLSSQLAMDTVCPGQGIYQLEPLTSVRIGGEAMGTVLFARGAANLSGNFNYKLQFTFTPSPDMCLKGSHGYDPMNLSFEAYYQLWNVAKADWGKARVWRPSFLSWDVTRGKMKQWFDDTCIVTEKSGTPSPINHEREIEK